MKDHKTWKTLSTHMKYMKHESHGTRMNNLSNNRKHLKHIHHHHHLPLCKKWLKIKSTHNIFFNHSSFILFFVPSKSTISHQWVIEEGEAWKCKCYHMRISRCYQAYRLFSHSYNIALLLHVT